MDRKVITETCAESEVVTNAALDKRRVLVGLCIGFVVAEIEWREKEVLDGESHES